MARALISGAAGFIGSHLVDRLIDEGVSILAVDDLSNGEQSFVNQKADFIVADFSDEWILQRIRAHEFDAVFHLAARPRVAYSVEHPFETNETNVSKTLKLLEACRGNVRRFINTSSSSVYGNACLSKSMPVAEHTKHDPQSPYALQKSVTEQYCKLFSNLYGLDTVSVRPFNVFGPRCKGNSPYSTAVSAWLHAIKHGYDLRSDGDGLQSRDMTYVSNVVDVFFRAYKSESKFVGEAFNAGTGTCISNNDILSMLKTRYPQCSVKNAPKRAGDVDLTLASMEKSMSVLKHITLVDFSTGFALTERWAMSDTIF